MYSLPPPSVTLIVSVDVVSNAENATASSMPSMFLSLAISSLSSLVEKPVSDLHLTIKFAPPRRRNSSEIVSLYIGESAPRPATNATPRKTTAVIAINLAKLLFIVRNTVFENVFFITTQSPQRVWARR